MARQFSLNHSEVAAEDVKGILKSGNKAGGENHPVTKVYEDPTEVAAAYNFASIRSARSSAQKRAGSAEEEKRPLAVQSSSLTGGGRRRGRSESDIVASMERERVSSLGLDVLPPPEPKSQQQRKSPTRTNSEWVLAKESDHVYESIRSARGSHQRPKIAPPPPPTRGQQQQRHYYSAASQDNSSSSNGGPAKKGSLFVQKKRFGAGSGGAAARRASMASYNQQQQQQQPLQSQQEEEDQRRRWNQGRLSGSALVLTTTSGSDSYSSVPPDQFRKFSVGGAAMEKVPEKDGREFKKFSVGGAAKEKLPPSASVRHARSTGELNRMEGSKDKNRGERERSPKQTLTITVKMDKQQQQQQQQHQQQQQRKERKRQKRPSGGSIMSNGGSGQYYPPPPNSNRPRIASNSSDYTDTTNSSYSPYDRRPLMGNIGKRIRQKSGGGGKERQDSTSSTSSLHDLTKTSRQLAHASSSDLLKHQMLMQEGETSSDSQQHQQQAPLDLDNFRRTRDFGDFQILTDSPYPRLGGNQPKAPPPQPPAARKKPEGVPV